MQLCEAMKCTVHYKNFTENQHCTVCFKKMDTHVLTYMYIDLFNDIRDIQYTIFSERKKRESKNVARHLHFEFQDVLLYSTIDIIQFQSCYYLL